jgi:hypothetical protein
MDKLPDDIPMLSIIIANVLLMVVVFVLALVLVSIGDWLLRSSGC